MNAQTQINYTMAAVIYPQQTANIIICFKSRMSSSFYIEGRMHTGHFILQWAEPAKLPSLSVLRCFTTHFILFNIRKGNSILTAHLTFSTQSRNFAAVNARN